MSGCNTICLPSGDYDRAADDIKAVMQIAKSFRVPFKVIIEIGAYLMRAGATVVAQRGFFTQQLEKLNWPESDR